MKPSIQRFCRTATVLLAVLIFACSARSAEVRFLAVTKGFLWEQTGPNAPVQLASNSHQFRAFVDLARPQALSAASLKWPNPPGATRSLVNRTTFWDFAERFNTRSQLNNAHPNGSYSLATESAADGRRTNQVTLSADVYPIALRVSNFAETQAVDHRADFALRWDPAGTGANGYVHLRILRDGQLVFQSPAYPQAAGALNGNSSAFVIPRNTLAEGLVYQGEITIFRKITEDTKGYPGVSAWAAYTQTTTFPLRTVFTTTDVLWYGYAKVQRMIQTTSEPPAIAPGNAFEFLAFADGALPTSIHAAAAGSVAMTKAQGAWRLREGFATQAALDARFPLGALSLVLDTAHNGVRSQPLALSSLSYPGAPHISNFHEANVIEPGQPFTLRWQSLPGGTAADFVQVQVRKGEALVLASPEHPFSPGALNGTSSALTLPANLLAPGESCEVSILFLKASLIDSFSYPKVLGLCGCARQTTATIRARGGNITTPALRNFRRAGASVQFDFQADPGRQYVVQGSADLKAWANLLITNAPGAAFTLQLPIDFRQNRFLRVSTQ